MEGACEFFTFASLLNRIVDFGQYSNNLRMLLSSAPDEYVEPQTESMMRKDGREPQFRDFLTNWLSDPKIPLAILLADYGQGKTTCCLNVLREWLRDRSSWDGRVPLYVRLRDVANQGYRLSAIVRVALHEGLGLTYPTFELLLYLAKRGRLFFIFDGLDEVSFSGFWSEIAVALREISSLAVPGNKVLITSRPGVFANEGALLYAMQSLNVAHFTEARLKYFDKDRAIALCSACGIYDPKSIVEQLYAHDGLADLARRPITLRMIVDSVLDSQLNLDELSSSADVYRTYTDKWLARDNWRSTIQIASSKVGEDFKTAFVERMAWQMYITKVFQVDAEFVEAQVEEFFGKMRGVKELIPAFANEIRLCSFLDWAPSGRLVFSHKSFFDYFAARYLAEQPPAILIAILKEKLIDRSVFSFLVSIRSWKEFTRLPEVDLSTKTSPILGLNLLTAAHSAGELLALTTSLPVGTNAVYEGAGPVALEIFDSKIELLSINAHYSSSLTLRNVAVERLVVSCEGSLNIELEDCVIGNLECRVGTDLRIHPARVRTTKGSLVFGSLTIVDAADCVLGGVIISAPEFTKIEEAGKVLHVGAGKPLNALGLSARRPSKGARRAKASRGKSPN